MPRSYAPLMTSIWADDDFRQRSPEAQRVYILALSQPNISYAGVVPFTARRWARMACGTTPEDIAKAVDELIEARFVLLDDDTEELWIRSFVKHNGVLEQPQLRKAMHKAFADVLSTPIRQALLAQLPDAERTLLAPSAKADDSPPEGCAAGTGHRPVSESGQEPSSSSSPPDDDDERTHAAATLIAERVLALRTREKGPAGDSEAWLRKVTRQRLDRHRDAARAFLDDHPNATPTELADHLEPDLAPRRAARFDPDCSACDGLTWIDTDDGMAPCPHCRPKRPGA